MAIDKNVVVGGGLTIRYGITIGNCGAGNMACSHIGNGVEFGTSIIVLGDIALGSNVTVGADSMIFDFVPDNALMVGKKTRVEVIR